LVNMNSFEMLKGAYPARIYSNLLAIVDAFKNPEAGYEIIDRRFVGKEVKKVRGSLEGFFGGES